jgi:hypothetical protein
VEKFENYKNRFSDINVEWNNWYVEADFGQMDSSSRIKSKTEPVFHKIKEVKQRKAFYM